VGDWGFGKVAGSLAGEKVLLSGDTSVCVCCVVVFLFFLSGVGVAGELGSCEVAGDLLTGVTAEFA